jgi:hypothetical protein
MDIFLLFFYSEHSMRTKANTKTAMNTDHRFIYFIIPEYCTDEARILAMATSDAFCHFQAYTAAFTLYEGICRAHSSTGRILTGTADNHGKPPLHTPDRSHTDAGFRQSGLILPSRTGKHTNLAPDTFLCFQYG